MEGSCTGKRPLAGALVRDSDIGARIRHVVFEEDCDVVSLMAARSRRARRRRQHESQAVTAVYAVAVADPFGASAVEIVTITLNGIDGDLIPI